MINYKLISNAIEFYQAKGYKYIEVPWLVSHSSLDVTRPPNARPFDTFAGSLVASGEQSFIEMMDRGEISNGMYVCCTPCFRDDEFDEIHHMWFMKVELIYINPIDEALALEKVKHDAMEFYKGVYFGFRSVLADEMQIAFIETPEGFDIVNNGYRDTNDSIELGSYGIRHWCQWRWVYGTGVAEPRTSFVEKMGDTYP